uniref:Putative pyruvate dehydrogenase E1 component subunit alpha, mitochondrial n=1 Tax=Lygus hesperus TaxID=30085 RepID=A0A0A9XQ64_LYGHE
MQLARNTFVQHSKLKRERLACRRSQLCRTSYFQTVTETKKIKDNEQPFQGTTDEVSIEIEPFLKHKLITAPSTTVKLNRADGLKMYKQMNIIRKLELAAAQLYKDKKIRGFCHLYTGQEGVAVGIKTAMREQDTVISSYRAHGWHYLMSDSAVSLMSELTGKVTGCCRGKGGSMHLYAKNFFGGNGIVGAQVPLGTGIALYHKLQNTGGVSFTVYGDGAANQGQVFESFNMAKLWNLPVVFVCENNH